MNRNHVIEALLREQELVTRNLQESVERYQIASDIDEEATKDPEDFSRQAEAKDMQLRFEQLLSKAKEDLKFLESELSSSHTKVEKGALIKTNKNWFFIGISLPQTLVKEELVISFTEGAPIYQQVKGVTKGSSVTIGNETYEILEIL